MSASTKLPSSSRSGTRALALRALVLAALAAVLATVVAHGRHELAGKRIRVVEPGRIWRGAAQEALPYERLVATHGIRTIVTLLGESPDDPQEIIEQALAASGNLELLRFPMPGTGLADFDKLEAAAAVLADPAREPLFVHCAAGVQRTGAVVAVYRMKHQGWSFERAMEEMDTRGAHFEDDKVLLEHMRTYYESRIAPTRPK